VRLRLGPGAWSWEGRCELHRDADHELRHSSLRHLTHHTHLDSKPTPCRRREAAPHIPTFLEQAPPALCSHAQASALVMLRPSIGSAPPLRTHSTPPPTMRQQLRAHVLGAATQQDRAQQDLVLVSRLWAPRTRRSSVPSVNRAESLLCWACLS
jgi:hypothetical protein